MFLMSCSTILCNNLLFFNQSPRHKSFSFHSSSGIVVRLSGGRRKNSGLVPNAKKSHSRKISWWKKFFFDGDGIWFGLKDEDMHGLEESERLNDEESEDEKFEAWRRRAEAIVELREAQEDMRNEEHRRWEDWLVDGPNNDSSSSWVQDRSNGIGEPGPEIPEDLDDQISGKALAKSARKLILGRNDDELLYEDRVFEYASYNSAQFLAVLIIVPWALDFLIHDYVLMPFLDRYVKTVPLAAELLDVRRPQKLEIIKELKLEKERFRFEVEIGKSPPLSDEKLWLEMHHRAIELREEQRLINRSAFANIWSDMVFGIALFTILVFNRSKVALLKFTGYKILNNISDGGKAFLIIAAADILLGYHSEIGWYALVELIVEHYGLEVDQSAITIFVSSFPVAVDSLVKYWIFKYLPRLSMKVSKIIGEMTRH